MSRLVSVCGTAFLAALVVTGCTITTSDGTAGDDAGASSSSGTSGSSGRTTDSDADAAAVTSGDMPFAPANLPEGVDYKAGGDWVFNTETCGRTSATIDTVKGTVSCQGQDASTFAFRTVTQSDTSQGELTAGLFVARSLVIEPGMVVDVVGNRPLIVVAQQTVKIQGTLRASAREAQARGGGATGVDYGRGNGLGGGGTPINGQGAGGGGFCGVGGNASGGAAWGSPTNSPLLAGSAGGGTLIEGGAGGGAIQLVSGARIEIAGSGAVAASGGAGQLDSGGAGSGGAILLEAPEVSVFGTVAANGGGGGSSNSGADGSASADPAPGGRAGSTVYSAGGSGSGGAIIDGQAGTRIDAQRSGGGGGGAGRIRINSSAGAATIGATAVISPALTTPCATQGPLAH